MKITAIWRQFALLVAVGLCATPVATAEVKLPRVFGSNMVLQREQRDPVWGTAAAGEKVTVTVNGQTKEATADANGKWTLKLDPMKAGGPYVMEVKGQSNAVKLENVMIGEVWVCSGQSNMKMEMEYLSLTDRVEEPKKETPRPPAEPPAGPRGQRKIKFPISISPISYLLTPRKMEERGKALTNMAFSFTGKEPADGIVIEKFQTHQMKSIWTKE